MRLSSFCGASALAAALVLAGCGGSGGGTTPSASTTLSASELQAFVTASQKGAAPTQWRGPDTPQAIVPNRNLAVILCAAAAEGCVRIGDGVKEAGKRAGWTVKTYDGQGQASVMSAAIQQAVTEGANGIVLVAIDARAVGQGLAVARSAGVKVVSVVGGNTVGTGEGQVLAEPNAEPKQAGANLADWVVAKNSGDVKIAMFHAPEFADSVLRYEGSKAVFNSCSTCKIVADTTYVAATSAQQIPLRTKSTLTAHPEINYVWIDIGGIGQGQVQAIAEMNLSQKVKLVSFDCNAPDVENIRKANVQVACEGLGLEAGGWGAVDALNRIFAGQAPLPTYVPIRTLDASSIPSTSVWQGDYDFRAMYSRLWGK